jgi:hypothetical protein
MIAVKSGNLYITSMKHPGGNTINASRIVKVDMPGKQY